MNGTHLSQRGNAITGASRAYQKSFKQATAGKGDKTGLTRDEPRGTMLELGVRQMTQVKYIYTNAFSRGNKQEELEAIVQQGNYDLVAITET